MNSFFGSNKSDKFESKMENNHKLILIGDSGVGKTSLLYRYVDDKLPIPLYTTVGADLRIKKVQIYGRIIKQEIWDTAGQEKPRGTRHYFCI